MATEPQHLTDDGSTRCTVCGAFTLHFEGCAADPGDPHTWESGPEVPRGPNGEPPPFESFPSLNHDWEDGEDEEESDVEDDAPEADPRQRGDDDGVEYGDPRDAMEDRLYGD